MIYVCSSGQTPLFDLLVKHGADINHVSEDRGWTPLTRAAYRGHASLVARLLELGAHEDALTDGRTALEWAGEQGHEDVRMLLLHTRRGRGLSDEKGMSELIS